MIFIALPKGSVLKKSKEVVEKFTGIKILPGQLKVVYGKYVFCFLKHRDIPVMVERGIFHYGITSDEWLAETEAKVERIKGLDWCYTKIALIRDKSVEGVIRNCVTEFPKIARKNLESTVDIQYVSGSSEALVPDFFDCCVDCVESGMTLEMNNLAVSQILLNSETVLIGKTSNIDLITEFVRYL